MPATHCTGLQDHFISHPSVVRCFCIPFSQIHFSLFVLLRSLVLYLTYTYFNLFAHEPISSHLISAHLCSALLSYSLVSLVFSALRMRITHLFCCVFTNPLPHADALLCCYPMQCCCSRFIASLLFSCLRMCASALLCSARLGSLPSLKQRCGMLVCSVLRCAVPYGEVSHINFS